MSVADPIFSKDDAAGKITLPPELQGKTAEEIHAYYQRREQILQDRMRAAPKPEPKKEPVDDKIDLFGDPAGSIKRVVDRTVNEGMSRMAAIATPAIVNSCKITCRDNHADYTRFGAEIEKRMATMTPDAQMNPEYWELTYKVVKGEMADRLVEEERNRKNQNPVEKPTAKGAEPPKPRELSEEEKVVARKFEFDDARYREAAERYDKDEGRLPITTDNRRQASKKKAGS